MSDLVPQPASPTAVGSDSQPASPKTRKSKKTAAPQAQLHVMMLANDFEVRGSSARTLMLAENLPAYGIRPTIVTSNMSLVAPERLKTLTIREYSYLLTPLISRIMVGFIAQDFADDPPDLIHIQSRSMLPYGIQLARRFKCPYVLTIHDYLPTGEVLNFDRPLTQNIIAVSESVKSELLTQPAISGENVKVVHSGVDPVADDRLCEIFRDARTPVIGTACPLEQVKGVKFFLQAARLVLNDYPQVEFVVAGSGPEERNLRQLVRSLGISSHVTFVSNLYGFREPLQAMDIFCLPSLQQGLGTIMLEAMAWARPVVASHVGGISAAIEDGKTGLLVPPGDSLAIAKRLLELLNNHEQAREIGRAGQAHVKKHFRIDQTVRQVTDLYRKVYADSRQQQTTEQKDRSKTER